MIQETIMHIINSSQYEPSSGDNLLGMEYDIEHAFESIEVFDQVNIKVTDDNAGMFQIELTLSESVDNLVKVSHALQEAWSFIQYQYFEASSITLGSDKAALRFVTVIGKNQYYVTGLAWVKGHISIDSTTTAIKKDFTMPFIGVWLFSGRSIGESGVLYASMSCLV